MVCAGQYYLAIMRADWALVIKLKQVEHVRHTIKKSSMKYILMLDVRFATSAMY